MMRGSPRRAWQDLLATDVSPRDMGGRRYDRQRFDALPFLGQLRYNALNPG
jgi:hypothetical protein